MATQAHPSNNSNIHYSKIFINIINNVSINVNHKVKFHLTIDVTRYHSQPTDTAERVPPVPESPSYPSA